MAALLATNGKKTGTTLQSAVPDNPKAKLMYYFSCICTCVEVDDDPAIRRLRDYVNYSSLSQEESTNLLALCEAYKPAKLEGVIFSKVDDNTDLDGCDNQFYELGQESMIITDIVIADKTRKILYKMKYKNVWIEEYYNKPFNLINSTPALAVPSSQPSAKTIRLAPQPTTRLALPSVQQSNPSSPIPAPRLQIQPAAPAPAPPQSTAVIPAPAAPILAPAPSQSSAMAPANIPSAVITPAPVMPSSGAMAPARPEPSALQQPMEPSSSTVPDNPRVKLMYYLSCVYACLEPDNDSNTTARLRDYQNHSHLSDDEFRQLLSRCLALGPIEVVGKIFFPKEKLKQHQNEFREANTGMKKELAPATSMSVMGKPKRVERVMLYKKQWMNIYYHKPTRYFTLRDNSSCCTIL